MNTTTKKKIKALAKKHSSGEPPSDDEITVRDWMEETGLKVSAASIELKRLEKEGFFTSRTGLVNGRKGWVYKPV